MTKPAPSYNGLFIGLMSGTSMDGIDAALVDFGNDGFRLVACHSERFPPLLQRRMRRLAERGSVDALGDLDAKLGASFANAVLNLLDISGVSSKDIIAIGSHGQTIRHRPDAFPPFTLQIGDPSRITARTGITTVADFRRRDIAAGGQGAPLTPAFHAHYLHKTGEDRVILNIGGIANITVLPGDDKAGVKGFDTGPGNTLLDAWCRLHLDKPYDSGGKWATSGTTDESLLKAMKDDPYFSLEPPKSTGPEYFNLAWLETLLKRHPSAPTATDIQSTLADLTASSIADAIIANAPANSRVLVCGGGVHNPRVMAALRRYLSGYKVESTEGHGLDPDWVEAVAFAWLARQCLLNRPGNLPEVTGATEMVVLGAIHPGRRGRI